MSRLASFSIAQPIKKRGSDARGAKGVRWPHENPKAEQVEIEMVYILHVVKMLIIDSLPPPGFFTNLQPSALTM